MASDRHPNCLLCRKPTGYDRLKNHGLCPMCFLGWKAFQDAQPRNRPGGSFSPDITSSQRDPTIPLDPTLLKRMLDRYAESEETAEQIADIYGIGVRRLYRLVKRHRVRRFSKAVV